MHTQGEGKENAMGRRGQPVTPGEREAYAFGRLMGIGAGEQYLKDSSEEHQDATSWWLYDNKRTMTYIVEPAIRQIAVDNRETTKKERTGHYQWFQRGVNDGSGEGAGRGTKRK